MASASGPSLDPEYRRARNDDQRVERRAAILLAARLEFEDHGLYGFRMNAVARRVHLSKAALYGYFDGKHLLLATLTAGMLRSWLQSVTAAVRTRDNWNAHSLADEVSASLHGRDTLLRLLASLETMLEPGLTDADAAALRAAVAGELDELAAELERRWPELASGQGVSLVAEARAIIVGLRQAADAPVVSGNLDAVPSAAPADAGFDAVVKLGLARLFAGVESLGIRTSAV